MLVIEDCNRAQGVLGGSQCVVQGLYERTRMVSRRDKQGLVQGLVHVYMLMHRERLGCERMDWRNNEAILTGPQAPCHQSMDTFRGCST